MLIQFISVGSVVDNFKIPQNKNQKTPATKNEIKKKIGGCVLFSLSNLINLGKSKRAGQIPRDCLLPGNPLNLISPM